MFPPEVLPSSPLTLEQAIARMEGWYMQGQVPNRPQRNNNPGDIDFGQETERFGAIHGDPRFAVFPTAQQGWAALSALVRSEHYIGLTLEQCVHRYAPPVENRTDVYLAAVCHWMGRQPGEVLSSFLPPLEAA